MHVPTFTMYHPEHGECLADGDCRAEREALGWSVEPPKPPEDVPPAGDDQGQSPDADTEGDTTTGDQVDQETGIEGEASGAPAGESAPVAPMASQAPAKATTGRRAGRLA